MLMDIGEAFHSPFIVPVAGTLMVLGIVISAKVAEVKKRQLEYDERMAAIAKGLPLPPLESEARYASMEKLYTAGVASPEYHQVSQMQLNRRRGGIRRGGIVLIAVGIGLALFFMTLTWILGVREVLAGAASALIPFAIGVGLLVDAAISKREQDAVAAEVAMRE